MSTLQVANVHLETTGNNRIQYTGSNTFTMYAGGAGVLAVNNTSITVTGNITASANVNMAVANVTSNTLTLGTSSIVANNGYTRLPNGLLLQWGNVLANTTVGNVTFPVAFSTIYQSQVTTGLYAFPASCFSSNTTVIQCRSSQAVAATNLVSWYAIGV